MAQLVAKCTHPEGRPSVAGKLDAQDSFPSQRAAEYPSELANKFADIVAPLFWDAQFSDTSRSLLFGILAFLHSAQTEVHATFKTFGA